MKLKKILITLSILLTFLFSLALVYGDSFMESNTNINTSPRFYISENGVVNEDNNIPKVSINELNNYKKFIFKEDLTKGTSVPSSKHSWSSGDYDIDGSSKSATLFTNKYFTDIVGKDLEITAGSSNDVIVDLVHKGTFIQEVTYTFTIDAGETLSETISSKHLGDFKNSDNFYFRFNSNPMGKSFSVIGSFSK